jgi:predicted RecB family nuclease
MAAKFTREIIEAYLNCKTKGHLKLAGERGTESAKLVARFGEGDGCRGISVTAATLRKGAPLLADATIEDEELCLCFDGLKQAGGLARVRGHHYLPVLYNHGDKVGRQQRVLLAVFGLALARVQGVRPAAGLVVRGLEARLGKVRLDATLYRQAEEVLAELGRLQAGGEPPRLMLNAHCQLCEFRPGCRAQAEKSDDLSLLGGLSAKEIARLNSKGIYSVTQYSHTFRPRKSRKQRSTGILKHPISLQALAIREGTVYVAEKPSLRPAVVHAYLDVEGLPNKDFYYLIGLVVRGGDARREFSFWADGPQDEARIWELFLQTIGSLGDFVLFHYGRYETDFLKRMGQSHGGDLELRRKVEANATNVLSLIYSRVFFPVHANDLKSVASYLGFKWSAENASGLQSIVWRYNWEARRDEGLRQQILTYNREDCLALERVVAFLSLIAEDACDRADGTGPRVASVEDIKQGSPGNFGKKQYFFPELARITKCSYFDYQRERILFRTSPLVKRCVCQKVGSRTKAYRANKVVACGVPQRCPHCQSAFLKAGHRYERLVLDLKLFRGGVKRWVTKYTTRSYKCQTCNRPILPDDYLAISATKYGHNLCAWAVYSTVCLRQTNENVVDSFADLFGYSISHGTVSEFRKRAADYYRPTYLAILEMLRGGPLVHVDETKAGLRGRWGCRRSGNTDDGKVAVRSGGKNGYVWAFASPESVAYLYSPTRDGKVVRDTLTGFKGVLVSDFYTAYDSLDCPQQKCLIHLVRDFNDDLFSHPFDEELKQLGRNFTVLLQGMVETIDRFGLKRLHLAKHQKEVDRFYTRLSQATYRSETAVYYQQRLTKYKDKLFTFLSRDGVPWNNNNGENAIKRFVALRKILGTAFSEDGIKDYMVLLSIAQTLRYRGGSFWRFLLSRETDLDAFTVRKSHGS